MIASRNLAIDLGQVYTFAGPVYIKSTLQSRLLYLSGRNCQFSAAEPADKPKKNRLFVNGSEFLGPEPRQEGQDLVECARKVASGPAAES